MGGFDKRLIALDIDDHICLESASNLGDAIGSCSVIRPRHGDGPTELAHRPRDAVVIGGDNHVVGLGTASLLVNMLHQIFTGFTQ
jgi:hypothetical protein